MSDLLEAFGQPVVSVECQGCGDMANDVELVELVGDCWIREGHPWYDWMGRG